MPNNPIPMIKLRTVIRLYAAGHGLKSIATLSRTSRVTVKKYVKIWNTLDMSFEHFQRKSDAALRELFCVSDAPAPPNPRLEELERLMPLICKELGKRGMTTLKQWEKYIREHPEGYDLHCPDVATLNITIRTALERHNNRNLDRRNYSRREYFEDIERESLAPLNPIRFQIRRHTKATVGRDGYVRLGKDIHYYSAPSIKHWKSCVRCACTKCTTHLRQASRVI